MLPHEAREAFEQPGHGRARVSVKIVRRVTATLRARCASLGEVAIHEVTEFHHVAALDGCTEIVQGIKAYRIGPREPVNRDDSGFALARTGERLILL